MLKKINYIKGLIVFVIMMLLNSGITNKVMAQDMDYKAYTLFVYNFMKYIEWPDYSVKSDFVIGVMGESPITKELQNLAAVKKARGRTIIIKQINSISETIPCHLVYICSSKSKMLKDVLAQTQNKPVLVVAEREGLAKKGAAINFVTIDDDVLKFEVNKSAIEKHSLKIPSALITLGILVD